MGQVDHGLEGILFVSPLSHSCANGAFLLMKWIESFLARCFSVPPWVSDTDGQELHALVVVVAWRN